MRVKLHKVFLSGLLCLMSTSVWALDQVDGVYQIGSAEDLREFAGIVAGGDNAVDAVLTADIVCAADQPMIGVNESRYAGTFDGAGHTITLNAYAEADGQALFRNVTWTGEIKNLIVDGTITTNYKYAAGFVAWNEGGRILNCVSKVTIKSGIAGDGTHAGFVAINNLGSVVSNCLSMASIHSNATTSVGGIHGWTDNRCIVTNNLVIADIQLADPGDSHSICRNPGKTAEGLLANNFYLTKLSATTDTEGTQITEEQLKSGAVCFMLNHDQSNIQWTQNIGEDDYPVPFKTRKQVYADTPALCSGQFPEGATPTFSNTDTGVQHESHLTCEDGNCDACKYWNPTQVERDENRAYMLKTVEDMDWFAKYFTYGGEHQNAALYADIHHGEGRKEFLNHSNWYYGTFDGRGHTIDIEWAEVTTEYNGLVPVLGGGGVIRNLNMTGSISSQNHFNASFIGQTKGASLLENCVSSVNITSTFSGDNTNGGLCAVNNGTFAVYRNCIYSGSIYSEQGSNCGGLIGWSSGTSVMENVAMIGSINVMDGDNNIISRNPGMVDYTGGVYCVDDPYGNVAPGVTVLSPDAATSGELCYALNGANGTAFKQTLGTDDHPWPFGNHAMVYAVPSDGFRCDGTPQGDVQYSNDAAGVEIPEHTYVDGFCEVCGNIDPEYLQPNEEGFYEISTDMQLAWFSQKIAQAEDRSLNVKLMNDIDMEAAANERFIAIGTESSPYTGTFDGDFHTIDYLEVNQPSTRGVGLIGAVAGPAVIENLTLGANCRLIGMGYVGLIGFSTPAGGTVTFTNLGNLGYVECTTGANAGGLVGCCMSSACTFIITNCYSMATIVGTKENGAFSGWLGSNAVLTNCWAGTEVAGTESGKEFCRFNTNATFTNCWTVQGTQVNNFTVDQIETGQLAWRMNGEKFTSPIWYQNLNEGDTHPVADSTRGVVYYVYGTYGSVANSEDYAALVELMQREAEEYTEDLIAQQAIIDEYLGQAEALPAWEYESVQQNLDSLAKYYGLLKETKAKVKASADAYKKYVAKAEELIAYLESHDDFEGPDRDDLDAYLQSDEEPSELNPCGGYFYIVDNMLLSIEEIEAEIARLDAWLQTAINNGYMPGSEVTALLANGKFADGFNGWQGVTGSGAKAYAAQNNMVGAEAWNKTFDMYQKVAVSKPGYYMLTMNAGYRASNDQYSVNHIAQLYAGENNTYIPTVFETKISKDEAIDQVNANITGEVSDLVISSDPMAEVADTAYYAMQGQLSVAIAANSNRALTHIITYVEEGDSLLVGIRNQGSGYGSDWTGFANTKLTYLGEAEDEGTEPAMDEVIAGQVARANTILADYVADASDLYMKNPNFSQALRGELEALIMEATTVSGTEAKYTLIKKFSDVFNEIIVCKRAYVEFFSASLAMEDATYSLIDVPEVDIDALATMVEDMVIAYTEGSYSTEEALAKVAEISTLPVMPAMVDGIYQIETKLHMATYSAIVNGINNAANAVMTNDIDMTGVSLIPIGKDAAGHRFIGTFDGQGHKFSNLNIEVSGNYFGVFGCVGAGATIKNFILDNTCRIYGAGSYGGIIGGANEAGTITVQQLGNEGTVEAGTNEAAGIIGTNMGSAATYNIENCYVTGTITGPGNMAAICSWTGGKGYVKNCWSIAQVANYDGTNYFYRNTDITATNCYDIMGASDEVVALDTALLKTGELTYKLNGSSSKNAVWLQTIGTDTIPRLFQGDTVYYYNKEFINEKPVIELNAYAYDLATTSTENDVTITYSLNAPAKAAEIRFFNGEVLAYTAVLSGEQLLPGRHSVMVENSLLPAKGTALTYEVAVTAIGVLEPTKVGESVPVTTPYGMAINTMPESSAFGTMYLTQGERTDATAAGLYAYTPTLQCVNATAYTGGLDMLATDSATMLANDTLAIRINDSYAPLAPKTVRMSDDGRLFLGMANGLGSPIYEANPENLTEAWTPVFTGGTLDKYGATWVGDDKQAGIVVSFATAGTGKDLKLYTLAGERTDSASTAKDYYAYYYNLGDAKSWTTAPSGQIDSLMNQYTSTPHNVNIETDGQGGLWYIQQAPSASKATPTLKHYDANGKEDFSNTANVYPGAAMAKYNGGEIIAHPINNSTIGIYAVNYDPNDAGKIFPEGIYTVPVSESVITALAFDYAGNLYVASKDSKKMSCYAIPNLTGDKTATQEFITPSSKRTNFTVGELLTGIEDVNTTNTKNEIYTIGGVRVQKAQNGVNIINGKKVMVK